MSENRPSLPPELTTHMGIDLNGRSGLVTGATGGIGRYITLKLLQYGVDTTGISTPSSEAVGREIEEIATRFCLPGRFRWEGADITNEEDRDRIVNNHVAAYGKPVDLLVNNAGKERAKLGLRLKEDEVDYLVRLKGSASFFLSQRVVKDMLNGEIEGDIVNVSSPAADGIPGDIAYSMANAAMESWAAGFAREIAKRGIRINTIRPGLVPNTGITGGKWSDALQSKFLERSYTGYVVNAEEVADTVVWTASLPSRSFIGNILKPDAGFRG
jgi:3-oxoacyl-[acyl-carrier protein] reductase